MHRSVAVYVFENRSRLTINGPEQHHRQWIIVLTWEKVRRDTSGGRDLPVAGPWSCLGLYEVFVRRIVSTRL